MHQKLLGRPVLQLRDGLGGRRQTRDLRTSFVFRVRRGSCAQRSEIDIARHRCQCSWQAQASTLLHV